MKLATQPRRHSERGMTVVFFAIALTGLLAVSGLVLGGSIGYTAVRNAQTAADAAALAGTTALREHKQAGWLADEGGVAAQDLLDEIESIVADNGAVLTDCDLVNASYALTNASADVIDDCDRLALLLQEDHDEVAGVRVRVQDQRDVPFAAFVDRQTITASATAAATAQPVGEMRAPFLLCSTFAEDAGVPPLVIDETASPATYAIREDAIGQEYVLWGNPIKDDGRDCGLGPESWRGLADTGFAGSIGGWWETLTGNKTGQISARANGVGTCDLSESNLNSAPELVGCTIPVPLCVEGQGSSAAGWKMRCVALVLFEITHARGSDTTSSTQCDPGGAQNVVCGKLLGPAVASHGRGVAARPDDQIVVIKLVE